MQDTSKTLYIPLYGKAMVSHKNIILNDIKAEEIWQEVAFPLKRKSRSKWLSYFMAMRAKVFDEWTKMQRIGNPDALILHLGCGLDSRFFRIGGANNWYDVDLLDVIEERKKYYQENDSYHMIAGDVTTLDFLERVPDAKSVIVLMEGISMYMEPCKIETLFFALEKKYKNVVILMDVYTSFGVKMSRIKNPVKDVGVSKVYGIDSPHILTPNSKIKFLAEHSMTPQNLIDELKGMERLIFKSMYAGSLSKKIYRLYEYRLDRE